MATFDHADELIFSPRQQSPSTKNILVYFITGNPGLIQYYNVFLARLSHLLEHSGENTAFHVRGASLAGFNLNDSSSVQQPASDPPYDLQRVVSSVRQRVHDAANKLLSTHASQAKLPVILVGHSVGAYILLENVAHWLKHRQYQSESQEYSDRTNQYEVVGGICLFPTIVDIALSPAGTKVAWLANIPFLPLTLHTLSRLLFGWMPTNLLARIVQSINGMPPDAAHLTARFLQSRNGVRQALYLAQHELREISRDKWPYELWGTAPTTLQQKVRGGIAAATAQTRPMKLYFYWGADDYWVASTTRDAVIAAHGESEQVHMEIDRQGVPHDFCIRHGEVIAAKVAKYIEEIAKEL